MYIIPMIIGCCSGGSESTIKELEKFFSEKESYELLKEMVKTVIIHSESILCKVLGGLIQT